MENQKIKKVREYLIERFESDKVYKNWKEHGLLEKLSVLEGHALAQKLEEIALILLNAPIGTYRRMTENLSIPIVIRTFKGYNHLIRSAKDTLLYINSSEVLRQEISGEFDWEAEVCDILSKEISDLKL